MLTIKILLIWHFFTINFYFWNGSTDDFFYNVIKWNIVIFEINMWMLFNDTCLNKFRHMQKLIMVLWGFLSKKTIVMMFLLRALFHIFSIKEWKFAALEYLFIYLTGWNRKVTELSNYLQLTAFIFFSGDNASTSEHINRCTWFLNMLDY